MPSRSRSPAPLGAFQTPNSVQHCAVGAQNLRRHPPKPPGKAAASLRTISAKLYIYTRQEQQMGQEVCGTAPSNTTHKHQVSDAQTWRKRRGKPCYGRGGGHSRRCRHPKPPGINPAQQNAGLARQTPKIQQHLGNAPPESRVCGEISPRRKRAPPS